MQSSIANNQLTTQTNCRPTALRRQRSMLDAHAVKERCSHLFDPARDHNLVAALVQQSYRVPKKMDVRRMTDVD
jgi:hypothetical protein